MKTKEKLPKLNPSAKKWVKALRSGKYRQAKHALKTNLGFCCLGVACELYKKSGNALSLKKRDGNWRYGGNAEFLPPRVQRWLGLAFSDGHFLNRDGTADHLTTLNDKGNSFETIASIIEQKPANLFKAHR